MPSTEEAQSLKHWTTRKVLLLFFGGVGGAGFFVYVSIVLNVVYMCYPNFTSTLLR